MDKDLEKRMKENFFSLFGEHLIQQDENSATFEFKGVRLLKDFLDVLAIFYSDYQIKICKTSEHSTVQVFMRLEEELWKPR